MLSWFKIDMGICPPIGLPAGCIVLVLLFCLCLYWLIIDLLELLDVKIEVYFHLQTWLAFDTGLLEGT